MDKKDTTRLTLMLVVIALLVGYIAYPLWHKETFSPITPIITDTSGKIIPKAYIDTSVSTKPRDSATDNNVELDQKYTARINGETVVVPTKPKDPSTNPNGSKGIIQQEIDLTPIVARIASAERIQWETGVGIGVHKGSPYGSVRVQRNFDKDSGLEAELQVDPNVLKPKVVGGSLVYKKLF